MALLSVDGPKHQPQGAGQGCEGAQYEKGRDPLFQLLFGGMPLAIIFENYIKF